MWLLLDVIKEDDGSQTVTVIKEIDHSEIVSIQNLFHFVSAYIGSKMAKDIVVKNGEMFKAFMKAESLNRYRHDLDEAVLEANRLCFNYAASLSSFIDITNRYLIKDFDENIKKRYHDEIQSPIFDDSFGYALFSKLRNYVIHRTFPYVSVSAGVEGNVVVKCQTDRLLEWDNWTVIREKIAEKSPTIKLEEYVDQSSSALIAIWLQFIGFFYGGNIVEAVGEYGNFRRENHIEGQAAFTEVETREQIGTGFKMNPLPVKELLECVKLLQDNPCVQLNVVGEDDEVVP